MDELHAFLQYKNEVHIAKLPQITIASPWTPTTILIYREPQNKKARCFQRARAFFIFQTDFIFNIIKQLLNYTSKGTGFTDSTRPEVS